jgi:hypothetical protein
MPYYYESTLGERYCEKWHSANVEQIAFVWFFTALAIAIVLAACAGLHFLVRLVFEPECCDTIEKE